MWQLLIICFARCIVAQNEHAIQEIAEAVVMNLTGAVGDLNAINENYILREEALKVFTELETRDGVLLPFGFTLQSYATSTLEMGAELGIVVMQAIVSVYDVEEELDMGVEKIETIIGPSNQSFLLLPNNMTGIVCIFNSIWETNGFNNWVVCVGSRSGVLEEGQWNANWIIEDATPERIFASPFARDYMRFDVRTKEEQGDMSPAKFVEAVEIYERGLNVSATATAKMSFFAYLDMVQQQTLEGIDIKNVESPLLLNLLLVNQQIELIQEQLQFLPNYRVLSGPAEISLESANLPIAGAVSAACIDASPQFPVEYEMSSDATGAHWCIPEKTRTCTRLTRRAPFTCINTVDRDVMVLHGQLALGDFVSEFTLNFTMSVEETYTSNATVYNNYTGEGDNLVHTRSGEWKVNFTPRLQHVDTIFIQTPSISTVRVLDPDVSLTLSIAEPLNAKITLQNPVATDVEVNQQTLHGITFEVDYVSSAKAVFSYESGPAVSAAYTAMDLNCDSIVGSADSMKFKPSTVHEGINSQTWWGDCNAGGQAMGAATTRVDLAGAVNNITVTAVGTNTTLFDWLVMEMPAGPVVSVSSSLTMIEQQLSSLATRVDDLEKRVTRLEAAASGQWFILLSFVDTFASVFDLSLNLADKLTYFSLATRIGKRSLQDGERGVGFANELATMLRAEKRTSHYDPVEAINEAGIFAYQHGFHKASWRSEEVAKTELVDITSKMIVNNPLDIREAAATNPSLYLKVQRELGQSAKFGPEFAGAAHGVGQVTVLSSPIEELPVVGKALHNIGANTEGARSFLSNQYQRFPFHTSVCTRTFDVEKDGRIVLNTRFAGVAEPSIAGPTNLKNPRVKIGYVKFQHDYAEDGALTLRRWADTFITPDRTLTEEEVRALYHSFTGVDSVLSVDDQWELLAYFVNRRIKTRNAIDSVPLPSSIYLDSLDDLMFFDKVGNRFKYDLFNNNCQTFAKVFAQLATKGYSQLALSATDFAEFADIFAEASKSYVNPPYTQLVLSTVKPKDRFYAMIKQAFKSKI